MIGSIYNEGQSIRSMGSSHRRSTRSYNPTSIYGVGLMAGDNRFGSSYTEDGKIYGSGEPYPTGPDGSGSPIPQGNVNTPDNKKAASIGIGGVLAGGAIFAVIYLAMTAGNKKKA